MTTAACCERDAMPDGPGSRALTLWVAAGGSRLPHLARVAREIAAEAAAYGPVLVLEGGYNPQTLPYLVGAILDALGDMGLPITDPHAADVPVSDEAHRRVDMVQHTLRRWWTL